MSISKGQASAEFLFVFTASMAVISILSAALIVQNEEAEGKAQAMGRISEAEAAASALEAWMNSGISMDFGFHDVLYRIENGSLYVSYEGDAIEIGGVFRDEKREPL